MRVSKVMFVLLFITLGFAGRAQKENRQAALGDVKLIAVVNRADWCHVCQANGGRFASVLQPYKSNGVTVLMNDLTNDSTIAASKQALKTRGVYNAVYSVKRKGVGKMMQSCGLAKEKKQNTTASGVVTFINPQTHKQLKQVSIAIPDEEMKTIIDHLLKG